MYKTIKSNSKFLWQQQEKKTKIKMAFDRRRNTFVQSFSSWEEWRRKNNKKKNYTVFN